MNKFIFAFLLLSSVLFAQQPNHVNAELNDSNLLSSACPNSVAGFPRCVNTFNIDPIDFYVGGQSNQYFDLWMTVAPLYIGAFNTQYGIVDIDIQQGFSLYAGNLNSTGVFSFSVPASSLPQNYIISLQAIVNDPTHPYGARLTSALEFSL